MYRKVLRAITVMTLFALALIGVGSPAHAQAQINQAFLLAYYNLINLKQYQAAFAFWATPPQTYDNFVAGYKDTVSVLPYVGDFQPYPQSSMVGGEAGRFPGVMIGYHADGSVVSYFGCWVVGQDARTGTGALLLNANFTLLADKAIPDPTTITNYLGTNCYTGVVGSFTPVTSALNRAEQMLTSYYTLINRRDYADAYALWLQPIPGPKPNGAPARDYRLPFDQFVAGYGDTVYVNAYLGSYDEQGAYTGHSYIDGEMPAVLIGQHTDGTFVSYYGCYVMGFFNSSAMGIVSGSFKLLSNSTDVPSATVIMTTLPTACSAVQSTLGL